MTMDKKPKLFATSTIIQIVIAVFCIACGSFIIIFNIIIYPKFNSLIYSVIGLFVLVIVLLLVAAGVIVRYHKMSQDSEQEEDYEIYYDDHNDKKH